MFGIVGRPAHIPRTADRDARMLLQEFDSLSRLRLPALRLKRIGRWFQTPGQVTSSAEAGVPSQDLPYLIKFQYA
jgi:hypothetical protein